MAAAVFNFENYEFTKVAINSENIVKDSELAMNFSPSGVFNKGKNCFELTFNFTASNDAKEILSVKCIATFAFKDAISLEDIPDYFYPNSIAIVFPYLRAFISNVTLLANTSPIVLPTWNLTSLKDELKANTTQKD